MFLVLVLRKGGGFCSVSKLIDDASFAVLGWFGIGVECRRGGPLLRSHRTGDAAVRYPGALGHYGDDADTFAAWGVDSIKIDGYGCFEQARIG